MKISCQQFSTLLPRSKKKKKQGGKSSLVTHVFLWYICIYIYPIGSLYGIFTHIWLICMVNVGKNAMPYMDRLYIYIYIPIYLPWKSICVYHLDHLDISKIMWYFWWKKSCTAKWKFCHQRSWMTEILHRRKGLEKTTLKRGCRGTCHSVLSHKLAPVQDFLQQQYVWIMNVMYIG